MKMCTILLLFMAIAVFADTDGHMSCPMHNEHHDGVNSRGDQAMGFDHTKTTHHFLLQDKGGVIQVTANDPNDVDSRDQIRTHLSHIAILFAQGDFEIPMFIHDRVPPGVSVMKEMKDQITYHYESIDQGGKILITSNDPTAIDAIHDFLKFQIVDHETGDKTTSGS